MLNYICRRYHFGGGFILRSFSEVFKEKDFLWGSGTAAYQCEGAWNEDEKGVGEWDYFNHNNPLNIHNEDGNVASNFYHRYKEDIDLMVKGNQNTYRFSISWTRIFPNGYGEVNQKGIKFYNDVINYCLERGVEPNVTLFHYDLPLNLSKEGGWLNRKLIDYFDTYAKVCFNEYGDRVKLWTTINEPRYYSYCTNIVGNYPPNRHLDIQSYFQYQYNLMLASAKAIMSFKKMDIQGKIGIVHDSGSVELDPDTKSVNRIYALADFFYNRMILVPSLEGKIPDELEKMKKEFKFTLFQDESDDEVFADGKGDYLGLNVYNRQYVKHWIEGNSEVFHNNKGYGSSSFEGIRLQSLFETSFDKTIKRNQWGREVNPRVMYSSLIEIKDKYSNPLILITENGHGMYEKPDRDGYVEDDERIEILNKFLSYMLKAKAEGVNVKGYYHWATMDLYSWINGYEKRYGLVRVDFDNDLNRIPKKSYYWYKNFIANYYNN